LFRLATDDRLVSLIRAGQESAFEVVYDRYHRALLSFCRHMLGHPEEAADAVQHTFLSAYRDLTTSEKPIQLRAWLFTIARNRCLSMLRARRETASLEDVEPVGEGLAAEVQRRADLRDVLRDLARLPEDQRAALVLAELGALSHDEIATVVGCPKEKVKALVFQARSSLISSRQGREMPCTEIREQLANLRGGALRRATLRRHLRDCAGCREFRDDVRRQRQAIAILLPVLPVAGLKQTVLSGVGTAGAGASAGVGGAGALASVGAAGAKGLAIKALVLAALLGGGAGGVALVERFEQPRTAPPHTAPGAATPTNAAERIGSAPSIGAALSAGAAPASPTRVQAARHTGPGARRGNSAAARGLALTHGQGQKRGLLGTQPDHNWTSSPSAGHGHSGSGTGRPKQSGNSPAPSSPAANAQGHDHASGGRARTDSPSGSAPVPAGRPHGDADGGRSGRVTG
jgi:RNA polymerase sigma factor (sigma-70 family)